MLLPGLDLSNSDARRRINNELETISQVLYLIDADLLSHQTKLKNFVELGQSALRRVADACAGREAGPP